MNKEYYLSEAILIPCAVLILTSILSSKISFLSAVEIPIIGGLTYCFYLIFGGAAPKLSDALIFFRNTNYLIGCVIFFLISFGISAVTAVSLFAYFLGSLGSAVTILYSIAAAIIIAALSVIQRIYFCLPEKGVKGAFFRFPELLCRLPFGSICCLMIFVILSVNAGKFPAAIRPLLTDIPESAFMAYILRKNYDESI